MNIIKMLLNIALDIFSVLLIFRIVMSFLNIGKHQNKIAEITYEVTDVVLSPIQRAIKPIQIGDYFLDFAPLIVLMLINILQYFI